MAEAEPFELPDLAALEAAAAVVYRYLVPTPQIRWPLLSARCGGDVWVKHENHTPIGAFKVRGGLYYIDRLCREHPDIKGVITATRGNHGQSVAFAAARHGIKAVVVVPHGNNPEKNAAMKAFGAELIEEGHDFQAAYEYAAAYAEDEGLHFLRSFHPWLVQGVASCYLEFLRAVPDLDAVYVPVGLGSSICAMIAARNALNLEIEVVGVVAENANAYALSFAAGAVVPTNTADTIADGLAVRVPDAGALAIIRRGADRIVSVSEDAILDAMGCYFTDTHNLAEGAGAAALAGRLRERDRQAGRKTGVILTGGNVDRALYRRVLSREDASGSP